MAGVIDKGTITNLNGNTCRVAPCDHSGRVSAQVTIPWHLRTLSGNLEKGMEVVFVLFDDQTGILLGRMDGNWGHWLPFLDLADTLTTGGSASIGGALAVGGPIATPADVTAGSVSLIGHTHGGVTGGPSNTGPPQQ